MELVITVFKICKFKRSKSASWGSYALIIRSLQKYIDCRVGHRIVKDRRCYLYTSVPCGKDIGTVLTRQELLVVPGYRPYPCLYFSVTLKVVVNVYNTDACSSRNIEVSFIIPG